jgi:hypothetical protein
MLPTDSSLFIAATQPHPKVNSSGGVTLLYDAYNMTIEEAINYN